MNVAATLIRRASFSRCRDFRYSLTRTWDEHQEQLTIVGLNPSTADGHHDDPTIRRCIGLSRGWGYGGFILVNLFSWCSPHPAALKRQSNCIGPLTNRAIRRAVKNAPAVVVMWGNHGSHLGRDKAVLRNLSDVPLWSIGETATGAPKHLLYARSDVALRPFCNP